MKKEHLRALQAKNLKPFYSKDPNTDYGYGCLFGTTGVSMV